MMDAVEFVKAMDRMCESHETCGECGFAFGKAEGCGSYIFDHPEEGVRIVEEWSKAHPIQDNMAKFKEVFGFYPWTIEGQDDWDIVFNDNLTDLGFWRTVYEAPKGE